MTNEKRGVRVVRPLVALILVLSLVAAACSSEGEPEELTPVKVQMHFLPEPGWATHLYGIEHGIFEAHGIDLELIPGQGSQFAMQQLNEGQVQFAQASLLAYLRSRAEVGPGTTAVFTPINHPQAGLMTTVPADDLADLDGTTVGMIPFSTSRFLLPVVLTENGLDPESITIEAVDAAAQYGLLFEGGIDSAEVYLGGNVATVRMLAEQAGVEVYHIDLHEFGLVGYAHSLIVSDELIESDPDLVRNMVEALVESLEGALDADLEEIADLVTATAPEYSRESVMAEWSDYRELINVGGALEESVVATNLGYVSDALGVPHDMQPADVYTNEFIP